MQQLVWKRLQRNFALQFTSYLPIALFKILPYSKTIISAKKLSIFSENYSRCLSNFLQTHIFWNFGHVSRICYIIDYRNIWFAKVIIILIMTAQVLSRCFFPPTKTSILMPLSSLLLKYFCYVTWFHERQNWRIGGLASEAYFSNHFVSLHQ